MGKNITILSSKLSEPLTRSFLDAHFAKKVKSIKFQFCQNESHWSLQYSIVNIVQYSNFGWQPVM